MERLASSGLVFDSKGRLSDMIKCGGGEIVGVLGKDGLFELAKGIFDGPPSSGGCGRFESYVVCWLLLSYG